MDNLNGQKILLVSTSCGSRGGGEIAFMQQAEELVAHGCHVEMLLSGDARMHELAGYCADKRPIRRVPYRNRCHKRFRVLSELCSRPTPQSLRAFLERHAPQFVHREALGLKETS